MIRDAAKEDVTRLVDLAQMLVDESPVFDASTFDRTKTRILFNWLIKVSNGILLVAERDGKVIGAMAGAVTEHPFSWGKYAFDYGLFVDPAYRGGLMAARLVRAFEAQAARLGARDFRPGIMTGVHVSRTTEFYERLGYRQTGTQLIKELC